MKDDLDTVRDMKTGRPFTGSKRIDLGLALLALVCIPGVPLTADDMAAWCGCSRQNIDQAEKRALRKLRNHLMFRDPMLWGELRESLFTDRHPARQRVCRLTE